MITRSRRSSDLSGFERLEERRVLTTGIFLGLEIDMPAWVTDDDIAQAQEVFGGLTFTDRDVPLLVTGDGVAQVREELADMGITGLQSAIQNFGMLAKAIQDLYSSLSDDVVANIREFADKLITRPVEEQSEVDRTATLGDREFTIPSWVPAEDIAEVREKLGNVSFTGSNFPVFAFDANELQDDYVYINGIPHKPFTGFGDQLDMIAEIRDQMLVAAENPTDQTRDVWISMVTSGFDWLQGTYEERESEIWATMPEGYLKQMAEQLNLPVNELVQTVFKALAAVPGDSNGDGRFDSHDVALVLQAGEYQDDEVGNSTLAEGDWNGDGDFTREDIVFALQGGHYQS